MALVKEFESLSVGLTDEEILLARYGTLPDVVSAVEILNDRPVARAQLKKVVKWGNEDCDCGAERHFDIERSVHRHFCPRCWQSLLEEVKE